MSAVEELGWPGLVDYIRRLVDEGWAADEIADEVSRSFAPPRGMSLHDQRLIARVVDEVCTERRTTHVSDDPDEDEPTEARIREAYRAWDDDPAPIRDRVPVYHRLGISKSTLKRRRQAYGISRAGPTPKG